MDILKLEKAKLFEDLAEKLTTECNKKTYHGGNGNEEIISWAREAGIPTSSTLNTGEVLLGLLFARNVIIHSKLAKAVSDCINGGIQSLIHNQCKTDGWTTSKSDSSWPPAI